MSSKDRDLTRIVLGVLFIGGLIAAAFWILRPFLLSIVWATTIVVATWPLMLSVQSWLGRRRGPAVAVMLVVMLLAFVLPLAAAVDSIMTHRETISGWITGLPEMELPSPPAWVQAIPLAGEGIARAWEDAAAAGANVVLARFVPYGRDAFAWVIERAGTFGSAFVQFLLTVAIAGILYANGEIAGSAACRFGRRLGGERGENAVRLAGRSVRAVALGVIVTALVQTTLAGVGLAVAGIPFAPVLTALVFLLCIAQLGPIWVMIPASIWLYSTGSHGAGAALFAWSVAVGTIDNVLRPVLIRRGADLPLLLIFAGVIGGLLAAGVIGLFVGPVVLAVAYTLLREWVEAGDPGT